MAFCGSQASGTTLAHRILYLRSQHTWPTAVVVYFCGARTCLVVIWWFWCFGVCVVCVHKKTDKKKSPRQVRLADYITVLALLYNRECARGRENKNNGKDNDIKLSILPGYFDQKDPSRSINLSARGRTSFKARVSSEESYTSCVKKKKIKLNSKTNQGIRQIKRNRFFEHSHFVRRSDLYTQSLGALRSRVKIHHRHSNN